MDYKQIKEIIEDDYMKIAQVRVIKGGRGIRKSFYLNFSKALEELHRLVGPFVTDTNSFISQVRYLKNTVDKEVYNIIIQYCKDKFNLDIKE